MKILHLIQRPQHRGAEVFTCQLSNHLIESGHQVKIITVFEGKAKLSFNGEFGSLKASSKNRFFDFPAWKKLAEIIKEFKPDIVQANAADTLKYAVFSKKIYSWETPIVSRNASEVGRYLKSRLQKRLNIFFYKNVDYVLSVSRASEKDILNHFPFLNGRTRVIPVGLEPVSEIEEIKLKPKNKRHLIHIGGFTFEKNHRGLLKLFREILSFDANVHLHLLGDGPLKPEIKEQVTLLCLTKSVTFYGFVNNPLSYIQAGDVLVLPSIIEGLPGVLLEAMICKTPIVAYNVGGISEIVTPQTGNLIEKDDEEGFIKAVLETLERPNMEQVETAYQMVKNYRNVEIAMKFVQAYQRVIR